MNFERINFDRQHFVCSLDFADANEIAHEVFSEDARVYLVDNGSRFIVRKEGDELVLVAFEGKNLREISTEIVQRAEMLGFRTVRFHVRNPAIARLVRHLNPRLREFVYEVQCGRQITQ